MPAKDDANAQHVGPSNGVRGTCRSWSPTPSLHMETETKTRMRRARYNRKWWALYAAINFMLLAAVLGLSLVVHELGWAVGVLVALALMPVMTRMEHTITGGAFPPGLPRWLKSRE